MKNYFLLLFAAGASLAGVPADVRCEVGKLKAVASYASCLLKEEAGALSKSERFVSTRTSACSEARHAVCSPATPLPTTSNLVRMRSGM